MVDGTSSINLSDRKLCTIHAELRRPTGTHSLRLSHRSVAVKRSIFLISAAPLSQLAILDRWLLAFVPKRASESPYAEGNRRFLASDRCTPSRKRTLTCPTKSQQMVESSSSIEGRQRSPARRSQILPPDVEGLRAVAIGTVIFFHFGVPGFGGGFIGVDVFFVISGYVICRSPRSASTP